MGAEVAAAPRTVRPADDGVPVSVGIIPGGSSVTFLTSGANIHEGFDSLTSAVIDIGDATTPQRWGSSLDVTSPGNASLNIGTTLYVEEDTEVFALLTLDGAATLGSAAIIMQFVRLTTA